MDITLDEKYLDQWEEIINAVDKTHIPMRLINRIAINSDVEVKNEINVMDLRRLGYNEDLIKEIVSETILELETSAETLDYFLDVDYIAKTAQVHTDLILRELH